MKREKRLLQSDCLVINGHHRNCETKNANVEKAPVKYIRIK